MSKSPADLPALPVNKSKVLAEFERLLQSRQHMGVRNFLGDIFLEARNPFQKVRRKPQRWVIASGGILGLAGFIAYSFHFQ